MTLKRSIEKAKLYVEAQAVQVVIKRLDLEQEAGTSGLLKRAPKAL